MGILYHGSKERGLKKLEPHNSTHGTYLYATPEKVLALVFGKRCGDDLTYDLDHFDTDSSGPWELVEYIPGAFEKMFSNSASIYSISDDTFKDIHTGFKEVVSEVEVDVLNEEYYENIYDGLLKAVDEGLLKIYRYPTKPHSLKPDGLNIIDKWRYYKNKLNKEFTKEQFDRFVFLHPKLLNEINELAREFKYDYIYKPDDLVTIFKKMVDAQLMNVNKEKYIDNSYISICNVFPYLKQDIDTLYKYYKNNN